jgi:hypothetical protein
VVRAQALLSLGAIKAFVIGCYIDGKLQQVALETVKQSVKPARRTLEKSRAFVANERQIGLRDVYYDLPGMAT